MKAIRVKTVLATVTLAMSGCGGGAPADADIRQAMFKQMEALVGKAAAEDQKAELAKIKVAKCVKAELDGYQCEFSNSMGGTSVGRFKKNSDGWALIGVGG